MNEREKIEYYRQSGVVSRFHARRFQGPGGKWVDTRERERTVALLGVPRGKCLDLACGAGRLGNWLLEAGWDVVGLDSSNAMLKENRVPKVLGNAFHLPFKSDTFSGIASLRFLFHVQDPAPILAEISRVLTQEGVLVLDSLNWTIRSLVPHVFDGKGGQIFALPESRLIELAAASGLRALGIEPIFMFPPSVLRFLPLPMVKFFERTARSLKLVPSRYLAVFKKGVPS